MKNEEELRDKALQFQLMQTNVEILQERESMLAQKLEELHRTKLAIEELGLTKKNDAFIPIGSGNFILGKITDLDNILIGIGSSLAIKRNRKDALGIVDDRMEELEKELKDISSHGQDLLMKLMHLQKDIEKLQA